MIWKIDSDNDTGPNDDYFVEWWTVSNWDMSRSFRCDTKANAEWLCSLLNKVGEYPRRNELGNIIDRF